MPPADLRWFHRIRLPDGTVTPGVDDSEGKLPRIGLPESLAGKSVLDVGAWDGFFSFECERRGAARVAALDHYSWGGGGWGDFRSFEYARAALQSKVEARKLDIPDLCVEAVGTFDVVLCLGVLYHVDDPFGLLRRLGRICRELLIVETVYAMNLVPVPVARFLPERAVNNDPTNFWAPNLRCLDLMLRRAGFPEVTVFSRNPRRSLARLGSGRAVLHARPAAN